jgi:hypothetical protein
MTAYPDGLKVATTELLEWSGRLDRVPGVEVRVVDVSLIQSYQRSGWCLIAWSRNRENMYRYLVMRKVA